MQMYEQSVATSTATSIPLHQIFVQKQLELMVAQAWLEDNDALKQAAITLSAAAGVACAHTQMVMFEPSSSKEYDSSRQRQQQGRPVLIDEAYTRTSFHPLPPPYAPTNHLLPRNMSHLPDVPVANSVDGTLLGASIPELQTIFNI
ncbi:hypothetical protein CYMTET_39264 [Cymbomonas tetramitiformis]|uniref:Uncharacterized protein n=1 Tax=Cymbomonas tetramitiformis TaxID=36881 RepID=A0AAE0CAE9_9CHLO|nr:hypothetical protein CYMTET_39264 [Cymbomonas tetramitiformis]